MTCDRSPTEQLRHPKTGIQLISDDTAREFMAIGRVGSWFDADESRTEGTRGLGKITGTYVATGVSSPNGAEVTLDYVMDVTIDGFGAGTITLRSFWVNSSDGATTATDHVISGTGDFEGMTGFGTSKQTSDFGFGREYTADIELMLAPPTN